MKNEPLSKPHRLFFAQNDKSLDIFSGGKPREQAWPKLLNDVTGQTCAAANDIKENNGKDSTSSSINCLYGENASGFYMIGDELEVFLYGIKVE